MSDGLLRLLLFGLLFVVLAGVLPNEFVHQILSGADRGVAGRVRPVDQRLKRGDHGVVVGGQEKRDGLASLTAGYRIVRHQDTVLG